MKKLPCLSIFISTIVFLSVLSNLTHASDLWPEMAMITASDSAVSDYFGDSVSINGDYAVIGAWGNDDNSDNSGSAYIFKYESETWIEKAKLTPSDGSFDDRFGCSVSISGDYAIIGAVRNNDNGSACIFKRDGIVWSQQAKLTASDSTGAGDRFGGSVSISGDYAVIGAYDDDNGNNSGSAYIFKRDGTNWSQQAKLTASDGAAEDQFGYSVSISGDFTIVGAWADDDNGINSGSAYIFKRDGILWTEHTKLITADTAANDKFGFSVSISGNYTIVGAFGDDGNGSAHIFKYNDTTWLTQSKLTASDGATSDDFGCSVSISGDTALVGALRDDDSGNDSGSAYIFKNDGDIWIEQNKITAQDGAANDNFGRHVSISDNYSIIGSPFDDNSKTDSGSAYIFEKLYLCPASDLSGDCFVDIIDFAIMAGEWMTGNKITE